MDKLETLVVPASLGEWLQSKKLGKSGAYFSTVGMLFQYWGRMHEEPEFEFISKNKKELIEVILGSRGYRIEKPRYQALIKGYELVNSNDIYWNYNKFDRSVFVSKSHPPDDNYLTEMTEKEWNKIGINDSNADFIQVEEL